MNESLPASIRTFLLEETIDYVLDNCAYYREEYGAGVRHSESKSIQSFDLLDKNTFREHWHRFICNDDDYALIFSGSTTGAPIYIAVTASESKRIEQLYSQTDATVAGADKNLADAVSTVSAKSAGLTLVLESGNHGVSPIPYSNNRIVLPAKFKNHYVLIIEFLEKGFPIGARRVPIKNLVCGEQTIKKLALYCSQNCSKQPQSAIHLDKLFVSSGFVSDFWRKIISKQFNAEITPLYGLSEFCKGVAQKCHHCGSFHFPITVYPSLYAYDDIDGGQVGELLLSHLYPFTEKQILLNYRTADIVGFHNQPCEVTGDVRVELYGRKDCLTKVDSGEYSGYLKGQDIVDILEADFELSDSLIASYREDVPTIPATHFKVTLEDKANANPFLLMTIQRQSEWPGAVYDEARISARCKKQFGLPAKVAMV